VSREWRVRDSRVTKENAMRRILLGAAAFCAVATPAFATDYAAGTPEAQKLMNIYFTSTRICKEEGKFECHTWVNPNGTFLRFSWDGRPDAGALAGVTGTEGTWFVREDGGKWSWCRVFPGAKPNCEDEPGRKVGDTWSMYHAQGSLKGTTEYFSIVAGRH
jgi:hypothetical protein